MALPKRMSKNADCSNYENLHPKNAAVCLVKNLLKSKKNTEINKLVKKYKKEGLQNSGEYNVIFVGGRRGSGTLGWTYMIGVDYYDLKDFRSLVVVVSTSSEGEPRVRKVFSREKIDKWTQ